MMNSIGRASLEETIRMAGFYFMPHKGTHPATKQLVREASACFAFIQGTGLEMMLDGYHIAYDADDIRKNFYTYIKRRDLID